MDFSIENEEERENTRTRTQGRFYLLESARCVSFFRKRVVEKEIS